MFILTRVFNLFKVSADADLGEEAGFKAAFSNVVNFFMLAQSLILGLYALISEDSVVSTVNLIFCFFFVSYFVITYVARDDKFVGAVDRFAVFVYFVVIYASCARYGIVGISLPIYPFVAMVLHGRHVGAVLGAVQLALVVVQALVSELVLAGEVSVAYAFLGLLPLVFVQVFCIFVYYVALRWFASLVYEKNREVAILYDEQSTRQDLVERLSASVEKPLRNISEASAALASERMSGVQVELAQIVRSAALNAINNVNAIRKASDLGVPLVPQETVLFNLYLLVSNMLKLYRPRDPAKAHVFEFAPGVPEEVRGNSVLTRQVILHVLDSLDHRFCLPRSAMRIVVSRDGVPQRGVVLRFALTLDYDEGQDRREISVSEFHLVDFLRLGVTKRIVEGEGGTFAVSSSGGGVEVEFSLAYRRADDDDDIATELVSRARAAIDAGVPMAEATLLVMTADDMLWGQLSDSLDGLCAKLLRARGADEAVSLFSFNKVSAVLTDLVSDSGRGRDLVEMVRGVESGVARKVPVVGIVDPGSDERARACVRAGFDATLRRPFDAADVRRALRPFFA